MESLAACLVRTRSRRGDQVSNHVANAWLNYYHFFFNFVSFRFTGLSIFLSVRISVFLFNLNVQKRRKTWKSFRRNGKSRSLCDSQTRAEEKRIHSIIYANLFLLLLYSSGEMLLLLAPVNSFLFHLLLESPHSEWTVRLFLCADTDAVRRWCCCALLVSLTP